MSGPTSTEEVVPAEADTGVDPRFAARRAAVVRDERRRRLTRICLVAGLLAAAMGVFGLTRSSLTDVDALSVTGWDRAERDQILLASGIDTGTQLTDIDTDDVAHRVEALVPWISAARVSKIWPSSLRITVVERKAVAQVHAEDGSWMLLDSAGHLLERSPVALSALKVLEGTVIGAVTGAVLNEAAARGVGVLAQMSPGVSSRISGMRFRDRDIELTLLPQGTVAFGPADQVQMKLVTLETVLARVDQACLSVIDVRVPRRPLVRRDAECEAEAGR